MALKHKPMLTTSLHNCDKIVVACGLLHKEGDATLENSTMGGPQIDVLGLKGKDQYRILPDTYQMCYSHGIWRMIFL